VAPRPPAWTAREPVEFDEPDSDHAGGDGGWTVGYLDVLLLLVTLFAALLGATHLQVNQLRAAHSAEIESLTAFAPAVEASPAPGASAEIAPMEDAIVLPWVPKPVSETDIAAPPTAPESSITQMAVGSAAHATPATELHEPVVAALTTPEPPAATALPETDPAPAVPPEFEAVMALVAARAERRDLELLLDHQQLRLEVGDSILFASGTAELGPAGLTLLEELVTALADDRVKISVEGHTDDVPINTPRFPSNWELSSIRATTVARELIAYGIPRERLRVTGYADTRPRAPNDSDANRALNRRVSLVLEVSEELIAPSY
jgi:chemotaxis protein MotB